MGKVVGIDLGTTNSVVAVMEGGKPVVIANAEGMRTTPSVVGFSKDGERLVGQMARRQMVLNPQNTFYDIKRFIGRRYSELTAESKRVPYTIRRDEAGNIKVKCPRLEREFAPEEISAMILRKLADDASRYLGQPITGAVITVPAYFDDSQRQATRDAGRIAGLDVLRILNEPTAASLAYGMEKRQNQTILVFDLGGGTFDVSILDISDGVFEVKATSGDTQLGGSDFDRKIVDWLAEQFLAAEDIDLRRDRQSLQRLTEAAEKAKIELSGVTVTDINLPFITATEDGPKHLETRLTRSQFEGLCSDLVSRLKAPVKRALADAGMTANDIDEVVLVGGSTRIPMVQELVYSLIGKEPNQNVNPDEVVAVGAAIQAGILAGDVKDILLLDVTPLSLGIETIGGVMKTLIPRNTTIPVRRSDIFSTSENNQTVVEINILQGERQMASDNKSLGKFKLTGIPPAPRGVPQILVSLDIDANGILQVSALDKTTGREQSLVIQGASTLSEAEINRMLQDAEEYAELDRARRERVTKRTNAEALTFKAERELRDVALDYGMYFARDERRRIEGLVQELRQYLEKNDDRGIDSTQADLQDALLELSRLAAQRQKEEEEEDNLFNTIKRTFMGGDDEDDYYYDASPRRSPYEGYDRMYQPNRYTQPERRDQGDWADSRTRYERSLYDRPSSDRPSSNTYDNRNSYDRATERFGIGSDDTRNRYNSSSSSSYDNRDRASRSSVERPDAGSYDSRNRSTRSNSDRPSANDSYNQRKRDDYRGDRNTSRRRSQFQPDNWDDDDEWL